MSKDKLTEVGEAIDLLGELTVRLDGYDRGLAARARTRLVDYMQRLAYEAAEMEREDDV